MRAGKFAVEPGPIWFCGGLGVLPQTLFYCTENVQVFMRVSGGRGQGSLDPPENCRNIVLPSNAGPVKNHKVANLAFNVGQTSVCQQTQWRFAGGPMLSRLQCPLSKK